MIQIRVLINLKPLLHLLELPIRLQSPLKIRQILPRLQESRLQQLLNPRLIPLIRRLINPPERHRVQIRLPRRRPEVPYDLIPLLQHHLVLVHVVVLGPPLKVVDAVDALLQATRDCRLENRFVGI